MVSHIKIFKILMIKYRYVIDKIVKNSRKIPSILPKILRGLYTNSFFSNQCPKATKVHNRDQLTPFFLSKNACHKSRIAAPSNSERSAKLLKCLAQKSRNSCRIQPSKGSTKPIFGLSKNEAGIKSLTDATKSGLLPTPFL